MAAYSQLQTKLRSAPHTWLITGVAGFIGSNLLETLLQLDQRVVGLDNYATGTKKNLTDVQSAVDPQQWSRFRFMEGDIREPASCRSSCEGVDFVLHQAALASVPRSLAEPEATHQTNVTGFLNLLLAARDANVKAFVYASSCAVYGDASELPKVESQPAQPLSPYATTKLINEHYANVFARAYGFQAIGLRYFNVYGPRQDPNGAYAAVIPKWIAALLKRDAATIYGDGETSRDFCYVADVVQANVLAAAATAGDGEHYVCNIGCGQRTSLNQLFGIIQSVLRRQNPSLPEQKPSYQAFRPGDVRHSVADITKAQRLLGYAPQFSLEEGLEVVVRKLTDHTSKRFNGHTIHSSGKGSEE